jgi:hypothetical protein
MGISKHEVKSPIARHILENVEMDYGLLEAKEVLKEFLFQFRQNNPYSTSEWQHALRDLEAHMPAIRRVV